ncbi:MAG: PRC-barrel domain-containing protein [Candidatus Heimdallarchaeota archaeon]
MNLCQLNQFENISELRKKAVVCPDGRKMGRVIDVVFEENLNMHSFIIGGSFWEEFRESIGIIDDIDPVIPIEHVIEVTKDEIKIDLTKEQCRHKLEEGVFPEKAMMYSQMKRMKIVDYSNKSIGKICNMLFLPCGEPTFVVNANKTDIIPKGITSHWDLLVPHTNISEMSASYLKLNVNAEQLSMALNDHVLDADAAREYLNSLRKKNTAEMRAVARTNTGNYYR